MSNFQTTVSIGDIYGNEWWARNQDELNRTWDWSFRVVRAGELICDRTAPSIEEFRWNSDTGTHCRIILHRRKPQPPTLSDIYGVDEVTIPARWEWTGEFRGPQLQEIYASIPGKFTSPELCFTHNPNYDPRLILQERPKKVWFKAEEKMRAAVCRDWVWSMGQWKQTFADLHGIYLCATRHEEPDLTTQTVTQADIDRLQKENN